MKKLLPLTLCLFALSGCAVGAATSAYAVRANTADSLTAEGEQKMIWRLKKEVLDEVFREQNSNHKGTGDAVKKNN